MSVSAHRVRAGVSPRTLTAVLLALVVTGALVVAVSLLSANTGTGVTLVGPPKDSTAVVTFAGSFPAAEDEPLRKPLGIAVAGTRLYVAEAEAGTVDVFRLDGGLIARLPLSPAEGAVAVYPSSIAVIDSERIAVVDNAAPRVIVISTDPDDEEGVLMTLGAAGDVTQPVAVACSDGELFVADGASHSVLVFSASDGALLRRLGVELEPSLSFVGGMVVGASGELYVADSNNARVVVLDTESGDQQAVFPEVIALPKAVSRGPGTSIFTVDTLSGAVLMTDSLGNTLDTIASGEGYELVEPRGVAWIEDDQRAYVTDASTGRVMVFNVRAENR